jgi:long-chain acyl-CoA synthetase
MSRRHWLTTYGDRIPAEIDAHVHRSVVDMLEGAFKRFADRPAFRCFGETLSYAATDRLSRAFAAYLQGKLGVKKGDRVAVMMPNIPAFPLATMGILRAGAVQVNVNPLYTPRELEHQLHDAGAEIIVVWNGVSATLGEIVDKTPVKHVISTGLGDGIASTLLGPAAPVDARLADTVRFADALAQGSDLELAPVELDGDDLLFLQYTGGTTGVSKGAALSHRNLVANTEQFKAFVPDACRPGAEVVVTALPLYHVFALMVNFLSYFSLGAENWLVPNPRDMDDFVDILAKARCTVFTGVNTLFAGLLMHPKIKEVDFSRLRAAIGGGAAVLPTTSKRWKAVTGQDILEGYGLSETSPILTLNPIGGAGFSATVGLPLPSTDIKLLDDDGKEAAIGEAGEVCAKGPQVMKGYWQKPEANAAAFTADGYFRTGDIGVFNAEGYLKIVDRKKDMIIVSGFNVYPNEVEAVAAACPGVAECACVGTPDPKTGEAVKLFVVALPRRARAVQGPQAGAIFGQDAEVQRGQDPAQGSASAPLALSPNDGETPMQSRPARVFHRNDTRRCAMAARRPPVRCGRWGSAPLVQWNRRQHRAPRADCPPYARARTDHLRHPGRRPFAFAAPAVPLHRHRPPGRAGARASWPWAVRRVGHLLGRSGGAAVCEEPGTALPASDPVRHRDGYFHGPRAPRRIAETGEPQALHERRILRAHRRRHLRRRVPARSPADRRGFPVYPLAIAPRLLPPAFGHCGLDEPPLVVHARAAHAGDGRRRRSDLASAERAPLVLADPPRRASGLRLRSPLPLDPTRRVRTRDRGVSRPTLTRKET